MGWLQPLSEAGSSTLAGCLPGLGEVVVQWSLSVSPEITELWSGALQHPQVAQSTVRSGVSITAGIASPGVLSDGRQWLSFGK